MTSVVLLLGGNVGDVEQTFARVKADLQREVGKVTICSSVFRSEAWGFEAEAFLNQAVVVESELKPLELLDLTQAIEQRWGRKREREAADKQESGQRYCSRTIDIDIIFYGDCIIKEERLVVPHALLCERRFVLDPLNEILPNFVHPVLGLSVAEILKRLE